MKNKLSLMLILVFFILACNMPMGRDTSPPLPNEVAPPLPHAENEGVPANPPPENTPVPTEIPDAPIVHLTQPGEPSRIRTWVTDRSSASYASEHRAVADGFEQNLFERPFTAGEMIYQAHLDITKVEMGEGGEWIYVVLHLEGAPPAGSEAFYAIEIDVNRDGRGDWLIGATAPPSTTWTTDGVSVLRDTNNDVGGTRPMLSDAPLSGIDGYDELVFDAGQGADPDAAWARIDPASPQRVEVAFKHSVIASAETFLFGGWSDEGVREGGWFDYNDHFTLAEAGSPLSNSPHYPLATLFSVDNTCRWGYGFEPTTAYPGLCLLPEPTPVPVVPTPTEVPDICFPPTTYVCNNWNYTTCTCDDPPPSCDPPPQGCGENSSWVGYPDCYCAPY